MSGKDSHFELYPDAILKAIYENSSVKKFGASVGRAVVEEARNGLLSSGDPEAAQVAQRVVYRPQSGLGVTQAKTPSTFRDSGLIKPFVVAPIPDKHTYLVGIVASNHPATLLWEDGKRGRSPREPFRTAFNNVAKRFSASVVQGSKFGKKPRPPKGGKR